MQYLGIRVKEPLHKTIKIPEPTMVRYITSTLEGRYVECIYWLDTYLVSYKQLKWISDIKTKISIFIPEVEFITYNKSFTYDTSKGEPFSLWKLSTLWQIAVGEIELPIKRVQLPPLPQIDLDKEGDLEKLIKRELYRPMLIHAKNLYYYHSFHFEAVMCGINEALAILGLTLSHKLKNKLCEEVYGTFKEELLANPHKYKQKLLGKEKESEITKRTKALHEARANKGKESIETNRKKILEAIESNPLLIKPNGKYNISSIARITGLSRPTITKIISTI